MKHKALKVGLTSLVLALSFGGLLYSTMSESTEYYKHVEEVMGAARRLVRQAAAAAWLREARVDFQEAQLARIQASKSRARATWCRRSYTGVVPDTFKDDAEVVLKGVLGPDGFKVHPNGVMAKCPSKYQAKVGAAGAAAATASRRAAPTSRTARRLDRPGR